MIITQSVEGRFLGVHSGNNARRFVCLVQLNTISVSNYTRPRVASLDCLRLIHSKKTASNKATKHSVNSFLNGTMLSDFGAQQDHSRDRKKYLCFILARRSRCEILYFYHRFAPRDFHVVRNEKNKAMLGYLA